MKSNRVKKSEFALQKAIETLASVKKRKAMFFIPSVEAAENFLTGFNLALIAIGVPVTYDSWHTTLESRGWKWTSIGVVPSMKARGLTDEQIMDELIDSLAETLKGSVPEK